MSKYNSIQKENHRFTPSLSSKYISESTYAALIHVYTTNNMQDKAKEVLDSLINGLYGDHIQPTLTTFTSSMLGAMRNNDWKNVIEIDTLMREKDIKPSGITLQGVLLANFRENNIDRAMEVIEEAVQSKIPMDKSTFLLCVKYMLPNLYKSGDVALIRDEMRKLASNSSSDIADKAMELNKRLRDCLMEDQRQPSKARNVIVIERERERQWRLALSEAMDLSKMI